MNSHINLKTNGDFEWKRERPAADDATAILPITALADHGLLQDNGLLSNKMINEYGLFVFKDIQARMHHAELKTDAGDSYRQKRSFRERFQDFFKRKEQSDIQRLSKKEQAIYTERELAERMVKIIRLIQPIERLLNRPDMRADEMQAVLTQAIADINSYILPEFSCKDLHAVDNLKAAEEKDLKNLVAAIERLKQRLKDTDNNAEIQKWLIKRFDQLNRGFESRIRNANIYKAAGNTGGLTLGRAYDTVQNVKKLFRLTGHYYAETGTITPEMQHTPAAEHAAFSTKIYPLRSSNAAETGNALKLAHYMENGNYAQAQTRYRANKKEMLKEDLTPKPKKKILQAIIQPFSNFGSRLSAKVTEEIDFSFGQNWRSSTSASEQKTALETMALLLQGIDQKEKTPADTSNEMQFAHPSTSLQLVAMGDFFTSTSKFTENFVEFFAEQMSDKRPFISVVAFSIYGLCGLTVFDPVMAKAVFGIATNAVEKLAASLALQKLTGAPITLSPDPIVNAISAEAAFIAKHLGSNGSAGAKLITSSLVNMQAYVFSADFIGLPANESGFITEIVELARKNQLTPNSLEALAGRHGINIVTALAILGIGMSVGLLSSYAGMHGIPLNMVFELPIHDLTNPLLAPGAALNASIISLKSVGAYYESVYTAGAEVSKSGIPLEKNDIDYAMLVMFLSGFALDAKDPILKNQLKRLLREYPGLIKHAAVLEAATKFNCVPAKSSWPAALIWGTFKPVVIMATWLLSIPRLIGSGIVCATTGTWPSDYQPALRTFFRGPVAGWLLAKRLATTAITFGRMLTRLSIEVPYRFINKGMTLLDAAVTGVYKKWRTVGKLPLIKMSHANEIETAYVTRCQNRNNRFVNFIGWLDDTFAKPLTNVLLRNAEQTTQLLLATGTVTRESRKALYDATLEAIATKQEACTETTTTIFQVFNITEKPHIPMVANNLSSSASPPATTLDMPPAADSENKVSDDRNTPSTSQTNSCVIP